MVQNFILPNYYPKQELCPFHSYWDSVSIIKIWFKSSSHKNLWPVLGEVRDVAFSSVSLMNAQTSLLFSNFVGSLFPKGPHFRLFRDHNSCCGGCKTSPRNLYTLGKSSNRSPGNFNILAKISNIQKIPIFQRKVYSMWLIRFSIWSINLL